MSSEQRPASWWSRGFLALLATQFFGAANDNILKGVLTFMVIEGVWQGMLGQGGQGLVFVIFNIPFILLSGYAGKFADRNSKRRVSVLVKAVEIPIALVGCVGFWTQNLWVTLFALVLLCCQSAFFGPAKYGMVPELVSEDQLSRANGVLNMMTNLAVIAGTYVAGAVSDAYDPLHDGAASAPLLWLPGAVMTLVAVAGVVSVVFLPPLEPGDRNVRYDWNPMSTYLESFRAIGQSSLMWVMLAWGYFYFFAGLALMIIPEYTTVLAIDRKGASLILALLGVTIAAGSVTAGWVSGKRIEPRLVPIGAAGLAVFFVLLGVVPPTFANVCVFVGGAGFFAGFYIIPLQALLQQLSPLDERGRFLGTANAVSFAFLCVAGGLYWTIRGWFDHPQEIFLLCALLLLIGAGWLLSRVWGMVYGGRSSP